METVEVYEATSNEFAIIKSSKKQKYILTG